jgi:hypothetical protein
MNGDETGLNSRWPLLRNFWIYHVKLCQRIERNYACRPGGLFQNWRCVKSIFLLAAVPACLPRQARSEVQTILPDGQWQVADSARQKELPESARVQTAGFPKQDRNYFWYRKIFKAPADADGKCILKATAKPAAKGWEAPTILRHWVTWIRTQSDFSKLL